jgi:hypothetical protein
MRRWNYEYTTVKAIYEIWIKTPKMFLYVFFISLQRNRFYVSFVYSGNELDKGNVHLDVFLPDLPDTPIFSYLFLCNEIKNTYKNILGVFIQISYIALTVVYS